MSRHLWNLPGGVHPPGNKDQSSETSIKTLPIPPELVVPLQQHIGTAAKAIVEVGQHVLKGQPLGMASGFVSVPVHAPTSGVITAIEPRPVQHPSQLDLPCVVIKPDGKDQWSDHAGIKNYRTEAKATVLQKIRDAGITGMGGAGFPTVVKVSIHKEQKIDQLIINGVECEPYITSDDRLMRERADAIVAGIEILAWLTEPKEILIGIEDNKPQAIKAMQAAITNKPMELVIIPTKYPSGGEKQLIYILTGKEVRSGGIPADIGVVCQNVGTAYAVNQAVNHGEPLISRITTVSGDSIKRKGNYEVLVGTPVEWLLQQAEVKEAELHRLILGGPMMGFTAHSPRVPVVKTTNCLLVPSNTELPSPPVEQPCIRCGNCAQVCPVQLLPQQLYWFSKAKEFDKASHFNLADCIECGACAYVCPSQIPLVQYYRFAKGVIRTQEQENQKSDHARERFEARKARLEREEREKELKRQERAKAAAAKQAQKKAAPAANPANNAVEEPKPQPDLAKLQTAAAATMKRFKEAQKALAQAEKNGAENIEALQQKVEQLKTKAETAKAAFKEAHASTPKEPTKPAPSDDPMANLKAASAADFAAFQTAKQQLAEAQANHAPNLAELEQQVAALKEKSETSKRAMKQARAKEKAEIQANNAASDPAKQLKIEVAKQQMLIKKANKALGALTAEETDQHTALTADLKQAQAALQAAEIALAKAEEESH